MSVKQSAGKDRIQSIFEEGTFCELGSWIKKPADGSPYSNIVIGYGSIGGKLAYALWQDETVSSGALDDTGAGKIEMIYKAALTSGAPVITVFNGNGAFVEDGCSALNAFARFMNCVSKAKNRIPQIAVIRGVCTGVSAVIAEMNDIVISVKDAAKFYVNSPFLTGLEKSMNCHNGMTSYLAGNEEEAYATVSKLIGLLPSTCCDGIQVNESKDDVNREFSGNLEDVSSVLENLFDNSGYMELKKDYGTELVTAIGSVGGVTSGVLLSNRAVNEGRLTRDGADKGKAFVDFCNAFHLPLVVLINSVGVANTAEEEKSLLAVSLASFNLALAKAAVPKISVVLQVAFGSAFVGMGSKSMGIDVAYALEDSQISTMEPDRAVAFLWNEKVGKEGSREELEKQWTEQYATSVRAAEKGMIDDILPAAELRKRIISSLYMLMRKNDDV